MKKQLLFVAVISALTFASCKKDRTCTCTYNDGIGDIIKETITYHKVSDKTAKLDCTTQPITISDSSGILIPVTQTCVLN
jgi:hypothetical protein